MYMYILLLTYNFFLLEEYKIVTIDYNNDNDEKTKINKKAK